jgi:hypothetical protein
MFAIFEPAISVCRKTLSEVRSFTCHLFSTHYYPIVRLTNMAKAKPTQSKKMPTQSRQKGVKAAITAIFASGVTEAAKVQEALKAQNLKVKTQSVYNYLTKWRKGGKPTTTKGTSRSGTAMDDDLFDLIDVKKIDGKIEELTAKIDQLKKWKAKAGK